MSNRRKPSSNTGQTYARRWTTETKSSIRTTELYAYVAVVVAIAITALVVGNNEEGGSSGVPFGASEALRYITYLTIGYMISRGLAKAGSYENDDEYAGS
jgi:hypothetical protein